MSSQPKVMGLPDTFIYKTNLNNYTDYLSIFKAQYFYHKLNYLLNKDFFSVASIDGLRYSLEIFAFPPFIIPILFLIFFGVITFLLYDDLFIINIIPPFSPNGLNYDWMTLRNNKSKFYLLDEQAQTLDFSFFEDIIDNVCSSISEYDQSKNRSLISDNILPLYPLSGSDLLDNIDIFFGHNRKEYSYLLRTSGFHSGDFYLLSQEYFDFYPIITDFILFNFFESPQFFSSSAGAISDTLKLDKTFWQRRNSQKILLKPDFFELNGIPPYKMNDPFGFFDALKSDADLTRDIFDGVVDKFTDSRKAVHYVYKYFLNYKSQFPSELEFDSNLVKLIHFDGWKSHWNFIKKFPIYQEKFFDIIGLVQSRLDLLDQNMYFYKDKLDARSMILLAHPSLKILSEMADRYVTANRIYNFLVKQQLVYEIMQIVYDKKKKICV
jgi:hypothetical protein